VYIVHCRGCKVVRGVQLDAKGKRALAEKLPEQAAEDEAEEPIAR
jgi:hypothetical protein